MLKHLHWKPVNESGSVTRRLYDTSGNEVRLFTAFDEKLAGLAEDTKRRYRQVAARFLDYLFEVRILGAGAVTRKAVNKAIDQYLELLRYGPAITLSVERAGQPLYSTPADAEREKHLRAIVSTLGIKAYARKSWDNTIAALNRFLRTCAEQESEQRQLAVLERGVDPSVVGVSDWDPRPLLEAVEGLSTFSPLERVHLRQASMLGGVIRIRGEVQRPRGLRGPRRSGQESVMPFPEKWFEALLRAATSWRDRALWTLLYGAGLRSSEGLNLRWSHIDFVNREVFVIDPGDERSREAVGNQVQRFKGRTNTWVYFRPEYRSKFFEFIERYRQEEYCLPVSEVDDFVFQYLSGARRGTPLVLAADSTLVGAFCGAVRRAGVPPPAAAALSTWGRHSLRHGYGDVMMNEYGLTLSELQSLMGHKDPATTRKYAKQRQDALRDKLKAIDELRRQGPSKQVVTDALGFQSGR